MAADDLATQGARSSTTMVLDLQDKRIRVIHEESFQLPVPFNFWEIENENIYT